MPHYGNTGKGEHEVQNIKRLEIGQRKNKNGYRQVCYAVLVADRQWRSAI